MNTTLSDLRKLVSLAPSVRRHQYREFLRRVHALSQQAMDSAEKDSEILDCYMLAMNSTDRIPESEKPPISRSTRWDHLPERIRMAKIKRALGLTDKSDNSEVSQARSRPRESQNQKGERNDH